ncbi:hypothetical protein [Oscillibacter sp.]|uniref:hypothetical protein n=1 Tax=Oscillibacter sp. TaxID=1945593 RepID=UPI002D80E527|nr:hypothetical protein [Oscillibacter sp.]
MIKYYPINEELARRANDMNSFFSYKEGSATEEYRRSVDEAARIAEEQKQKVDPIHHAKIDHLLDLYARRLAENINKRNDIAARVPSILIAGGSNFPVRKKEKQNRADNAALAEWKEIQGILGQIRGTGKGGISSDDPEAVQKLKAKLEGLERDQESMKAVNSYYRKHKTLDGCPGLDAVEIEKLKASMARDWREDPVPYPSFRLTNNNASIRKAKKRIEELTRRAETEYEGWAFDGGRVEMNREANRLQVHFDEKPSAEVRAALKGKGFHWSPKAAVWQRQLNHDAIWAAKHLECIRPDRQPEEAAPEAVSGWRFYIIPDLKTWADNAGDRSPMERFASFEEARARFSELRAQDCNSEALEPGPDGRPPARLTLGLESGDGLSAADILHVRQGKNYLVTDFTQMDRLREDPAVSEILSRVSRENGRRVYPPHPKRRGPQRQGNRAGRGRHSGGWGRGCADEGQFHHPGSNRIRAQRKGAGKRAAQAAPGAVRPRARCNVLTPSPRFLCSQKTDKVSIHCT